MNLYSDTATVYAPRLRRKRVAPAGWSRRHALCVCVSLLVHGILLGWMAHEIRESRVVSVGPTRLMEIVVTEFAEPVPPSDPPPSLPSPATFEPTLVQPQTEPLALAPISVVDPTTRPIKDGFSPLEPTPLPARLASTQPSRPLPLARPMPVVSQARSVDQLVTSTAVRQASPLYQHNPPPSYPRQARERGWQGTTWLQVEVLADGNPGLVKVVRTSGYIMLDEASVQTVRAWRFQPATRDNKAISSWVEIPIRFELVNG